MTFSLDRSVIAHNALAVGAMTAEYFSRGVRLERALRIAMPYLGLAEWRTRDRRRIEIVEGRERGAVDLLDDDMRIEIRVDRAPVWSMVVSVCGLRISFGPDRWHGKLAALDTPPTRALP